MINMSAMKYVGASLLVGLCAFCMRQLGEFHLAAAALTLALNASGSSLLTCIDAADIGPVTDLVLLPGGGVLVASMNANASQPGRISLLPSVTFSAALSGVPELRAVSVSGFSAHVLRPQAMHLLAHNEGSLLFVVQQWPASDRAFERYMQHRGAKRDEGPPQPLATVEVFLVVQDQAMEHVQLIHQRSLHHGHSDTITSVVAASPKQLYVSTSCHSHAASWWKRALEAVSSFATCSSIWLLQVDCGSEENCFDTHLGGDVTGLGLRVRVGFGGFIVD